MHTKSRTGLQHFVNGRSVLAQQRPRDVLKHRLSRRTIDSRHRVSSPTIEHISAGISYSRRPSFLAQGNSSGRLADFPRNFSAVFVQIPQTIVVRIQASNLAASY